GVDDDIDALKRAVQPIAVADVAQKKAEAIVGKLLRHLRLLELVAAEHDQLAWTGMCEGDVHELLAERTRAPRDEDGLSFEAVGGDERRVDRAAVRTGARTIEVSQSLVTAWVSRLRVAKVW